MIRSRRARTAAVAAAALASVGIAQLAAAAKGDNGGGPRGSNAKPLVVSGVVEGLYPGGTTTLQVAVTNGNNVAVAVSTVRVEATDAGPDCPASVLAFTSPPPGQVIGAGMTATVPVAVTMADDAPDACQGATFPLRHTVTATRTR